MLDSITYIAAAHKTEHTMNQKQSFAQKPKEQLRTVQFNVKISPAETTLIMSIAKRMRMSQPDVLMEMAKYYATNAFKSAAKTKGGKK